MLYKKYHRNYIRQFKKGTKLIIFGEVEVTVLAEPHVCCTQNPVKNCHWIELIVSEDQFITRRLILIDDKGRKPRFR